MRKMFSEKQIKGLAVQGVNEGIEQGQVQVGTKLYQHNLILTNEDNNIDYGVVVISPISQPCESFNDLKSLFQKYVSITSCNDNEEGEFLYGAYASVSTYIEFIGYGSITEGSLSLEYRDQEGNAIEDLVIEL